MRPGLFNFVTHRALTTEWVHPGALFDLDFRRRRYYAGGRAIPESALAIDGAIFDPARGVTMIGLSAISMAGLSLPTSGSVAAAYENIATPPSSSKFFEVADASLANHVRLQVTSATLANVVVRNANVAQASMTDAIVAGVPEAVAVSFAANDVAVSWNGAAVVTDTVALMPASMDRFVAANQYMWVRRALMLPTVLSDADTSTLSTWIAANG